MSQCPFCHTELAEAEQKSGRCPACGLALPRESDAPDDPRAGMKTVGDESVGPNAWPDDDLPDDHLVDPAATEAARQVETVDEGHFVGSGTALPPAPPGRETVGDDQAPQEARSTPAAAQETADEFDLLDGADKAANEPTVDEAALPATPGGGRKSPADAGHVEQTLDETPPAAAPRPGDRGGVTVNQRNRRQTFAIDPAIDGVEPPGGGTVDERAPAQTVDSEASPPPPRLGDEERTVKEIAEAVTLERSEDPAELVHVQATWGGAMGAGATAMTSLKREIASRASEGSTLVIHPRRFSLTGRRGSGTGADYEISNLLGEGGMGKVYAARQASIDRTVAVKTLKSDTAEDQQQREKFLSEAVVTGDLEHPNIVPIYDVGLRDDGSLFYSMKRVQGTPWMDVIHQKSLHENLEILMKVADAVAFAHDKKIVHRDLKPENIMLGGFGEVLVMDWGLAVPTDGRRIGGMAQLVSMGGTPAYMAPEMAAGPFERIGFGSDIYLLGAVLYEIITGRPPHSGEDVMKCLFAAARNDIQPTKQSGELLDVALKAMAYNPEDRYATVADFQAAIREYLSHSESIALSSRAADDLARAVDTDDYQDFAKALFGFEEAQALWSGNERARLGRSEAAAAYAGSAMRKGDFDLGVSLLDADDPGHRELLLQLQKATRERDARQRRLQTMRRMLIGGAAAIFLIVVTAAGLVFYHYREAVGAKVAAMRSADNARKAERAARISEKKAKLKKEEADKATVQALADRQEALRRKNEADTARADAQVQEAAAIEARQGAEYQAYVANIGLAAAKIDENAFDGARDILESCPAPLRNWEWGRLRHLCQQVVHEVSAPARIEALAVSPDGSRLVAAGWNGAATVWELSRDARGRPDPGGGIRQVGRLEGLGAAKVRAVAFSPDGRLIATGGDDRAARPRLWDAETGREFEGRFDRPDGHTRQITSVEFSSDGEWLLTASFDATAKLWNVADGRVLRTYEGHTSWLWDASFAPAVQRRPNDSPRSERIVTASQDGTALVWQVDWTMEEQTRGAHVTAPFRGHQGPIYSAAFSHDGRYIVSGGYDKRVLLWRPDEVRPFDYERALRQQPVAPPEYTPLLGHTAQVRSVSFSHDDRLIVSAGHDNTVRIWNVDAARLHKTLRGHGSWVNDAVFLPGDEWVASGGFDQQVKLWDVAGYSESTVLAGQALEGHTDAILSARFSTDDRRVVTASRDRSARIWDLDTGRTEHELREGHSYLASSVDWFPGEDFIATAAFDNTVRIWDVATGTETRKLEGTGRNAAMAVSPAGRWVLTGSDDFTAKLWDTSRALDTLPDADTLPAADGRRGGGPAHEQGQGDEARQPAQPAVVLKGHSGIITAAAFSPDGRRAATGDGTGVCIVWDLAPLLDAGPGDVAQPVKLHEFTGETSAIRGLAFTADGRLFSAAGRIVYAWDLQSGTFDPRQVLKHQSDILSMAVSADGSRVFTCAVDGGVWQWDALRAAPLRRFRHKMVNVPFAPRSEDGSGNVVNSVVLSPDDRRLVTIAANDGSVRLWDVATGDELSRGAANVSARPLLDFGRLRGVVWTAGFSPLGGQLLTVGGDSAQLWDLAPGPNEPAARRRMTFSPHGIVASAAFSHDGSKVVTSSWDNSARIWDVATGRDLLKLTGGHTREVNTAVFSRDGRRVLTSSDDGTARLWSIDWEQWERARGDAAADPDASFAEVVQVYAGHDGEVYDAVFSPDESMVLTASADKTARLWNTGTGQLLGVLSSASSTSARTGDNAAAAENVADADGAANLGNGSGDSNSGSNDNEDDEATSGHKLAVLCARFSSAGPLRVVTGSADDTAKIWNIDDVAHPRLEDTLSGHTAAVTSVAFSPRGGTRVLTGSEDYTAKLWDAQAGKEILTLKGHEQEVTSVDFSHDGVYALTGSRDGAAIVWPATPEGWVDNAAAGTPSSTETTSSVESMSAAESVPPPEGASSSEPASPAEAASDDTR